MTKLKPSRPRATPVKRQRTSDGLQNLVSGLGTALGKRAHNTFRFDVMGDYGELEAAYQSNWLARQIVDIPADDMTREWRTIKCKDAEAIRTAEDYLGVPQMVNEALSWARLYGGSAILMLTNQDLEKPLDLKRVGKGDLQRLVVFDRYEMFPVSINTWNPLAENFLAPEYYTIYQGNQRIHWTHFARFLGAKLPRRQRIQTWGWGDSELRKCLEDIKDTVSAKDGIAELMQEANVDVITREGLTEELSTDQENRIEQRYRLFSQMKGIVKLALLDGEESYDRKTLSLTGVAPVLENLMVWISGAAQIPHTRLFGDSASGLNATGDGDLKNYYDAIRSKQNSQLDRPMSVLDQVLVRSAIGSMPEDYNYDWNRLYQPNRKEEAEAHKIEVDADVLLLDAGVITRSQVMRRLEGREYYHFDEAKIAALEKSEDLTIFEEGDSAAGGY